MIKLFEVKYFSRILIALILLTYAWPNFYSTDRIGNQYLYLSIINFISIIYIYIKYSGNFSFKIFKESPTLMWYLIFIITSLFSILFANNLPEALIGFNQIFNVFISFYTIVFLLTKDKSLKTFIFSLMLGSLIVETFFSLLPIMEDLETGDFTYRSMKYSGLAANINITSFSMVFKLPFLLHYIFYLKKKTYKISLSILLMCVLYIIYILGTRGAIIGLFSIFVFLIIYFLNNIKNLKKLKTSLILIAIAFISSIILNSITSNKYNAANVFERAATISLSTEDGSVNQRLRYYKQAMKHFISNPIFGIGIGNWKFLSIKYDKKNITQYTVPYHAHNDFLQIVTEQGILGLTAYLMVFVSFLFTYIKQKLFFRDPVNIFMIASISIFVIDSMLNFPIARPITQLPFIAILSVISAVQIESKNEK